MRTEPLSPEDVTLRALLREARRDARIPFARTLAGARARGPARLGVRGRWAPGVIAAAVAVVAVVALTSAAPPATVASPVRGWHAPTDFLLARRPSRRSTDFLLRAPPQLQNPKGVPE